jgi:hypothetical protein
MTEEDEEFNRIEREAAMRKEAVVSAISKEQKEYERGFVDGMQKQAQSSVDKAVNAMSQREWVGLTPVERARIYTLPAYEWMQAVEEKLKEKNT